MCQSLQVLENKTAHKAKRRCPFIHKNCWRLCELILRNFPYDSFLLSQHVLLDYPQIPCLQVESNHLSPAPMTGTSIVNEAS